jgi:hypothetical protein
LWCKISQARNVAACSENFCWAFSTNFDGEAKREIRAENDGELVIITSVLQQQQQLLPQQLQVLILSQSRKMIYPRLWFMRGGGKAE